MENIIKIKGYHACKADGGWSYVLANAPFLSEENDRQWLTRGFYFWTDSDHFAHKWGKNSVKGNYAIVECLIEIEKDFFLDLVGSVEDQLYFSKILLKFKERLKKANPQEEVTICDAISFYRKRKDIFPYSAIKVQDGFQKSTVTFIKEGREVLPSLTRQQLCLFDFAIDHIKRQKVNLS